MLTHLQPGSKGKVSLRLLKGKAPAGMKEVEPIAGSSTYGIISKSNLLIISTRSYCKYWYFHLAHWRLARGLKHNGEGL